MTNPTQQIIKEAISKGFIPEKKELPILENEGRGTINEIREINKVIGRNKAIDSFQLEKIIELAYEKWIEEIRHLIIYQISDDKERKYFDELLNNLPNKEK